MSNPRVYVASTLVSMLAWQAHVVATVFRQVPTFGQMWSDFGGELPFLSRFLAANYKLSALVLVASAILVVHVLWKKPTSYLYAGAVFVFLALTTALLDSFATKALFAPILAIGAAIK